MDYSTLQTLIGSLGFPIVACCYLAYASQKQTQSHRDEMAKITEAVTDLKVVITKLTEKLSE